MTAPDTPKGPEAELNGGPLDGRVQTVPYSIPAELRLPVDHGNGQRGQATYELRGWWDDAPQYRFRGTT